MHALREDQLLALLGGVGLDDPDAAERLVQTAGHLGVDLPALAEERPQAVERQRHRAAERRQGAERGEREPPVQVEEDDERDHGGDDAAGELDEAGADDVADAFGVRHDPRDEHAGLRRVEIADGQAGHVRLDPPPHVGDRPLRGDAEHLRQREGRHRLDDGRGTGRERQRHQQVGVPLADDVVDQELGRRRQDEPDQAVDEHERQTERQPSLARQDERTRFAPGRLSRDLLLGRLGWLRRARSVRPPSTSGLRPWHSQPAPQSTWHGLIVSARSAAVRVT